MKYTKYADKYVHQRTNYAVYYIIDHAVQSMDDRRDFSQPTVAAKAGDTLSSYHVSSRESRLTICVRQQKFKRRAGMWVDQSSTSDHVT
jgi:hypothetical protein